MTFEQQITEALGQLYEEHKKLSGPPHPEQVLYQGPNPDGSRKKCANCFMWCHDNKCLAYTKNQTITKTQVCGYHIHGTPRQHWEDMGVSHMNTTLAGLIETKTGTSCDTCEYYDDHRCLAIQGPNGQPAKVDPKGCCAHWEKK